MASLLREIIRKPSYGRLLATSTHQNPYFLMPPPYMQSTQLSQTKSDHVSGINPENDKGLRASEEPHLHSLSHIYPSFSFGYFMNPNLSSGLNRFEPANDESETDDSGVMQADSVKKKRSFMVCLIGTGTSHATLLSCRGSPSSNLALEVCPGVSETKLQKVIFHPATGMCVLRKMASEPLLLGPCSESEAWDYTRQKALMIKGSHVCLQAVGIEEPAKLGSVCKGTRSRWETVSDSQLHLSAELSDGTVVCLDVDSNNNIVTSSCRCLTKDKDCDPQSQWFKIVDTRV